MVVLGVGTYGDRRGQRARIHIDVPERQADPGSALFSRESRRTFALLALRDIHELWPLGEPRLLVIAQVNGLKPSQRVGQ